MKIITANKFHTPQIIQMLKSYRNHTPLEFFKECDDEQHVTKLLTHIYAGAGVILLAEHHDEVVGMLVSVVDQSIWDSNLCIMRELAYWVEPEYRGSTAGYRLLAEYVEQGNELLKNGRIKSFTISKMSNSPDLKYDRFGFTKHEETWSIN